MPDSPNLLSVGKMHLNNLIFFSQKIKIQRKRNLGGEFINSSDRSFTCACDSKVRLLALLSFPDWTDLDSMYR